MATRPDVVGTAIARDLESLQDKMAPFPQAEAEAAVVAGARQAAERAVYASFGPAVAAASIAQVHKAEIETPDGRKTVAVKVLRPGVDRRFKADLDAFFFAARKAEALSLEAQRLRPDRSGRRRWRARSRLKWISGSKPRRCPRWRRTPKRTKASACRRSTGTAPRAKC